MVVIGGNAHGTPRMAKAGSLDQMALPQPNPRIVPSKSVKRCYTLMHVAETAGIRELADGEYKPHDKMLEDGIDDKSTIFLIRWAVPSRVFAYSILVAAMVVY